MNTDSRECVCVNFVSVALLSKLTHTVNLYSVRHYAFVQDRLQVS